MANIICQCVVEEREERINITEKRDKIFVTGTSAVDIAQDMQANILCLGNRYLMIHGCSEWAVGENINKTYLKLCWRLLNQKQRFI